DVVALVEQVVELLDRLLGRGARRDHQPHVARLLQLRDEVGERLRARHAMALPLPDLRLRAVPAHDLVVRVAQDAMDHVAAHLAEAYEADLHHSISLILSVRRSTASAGSPSSRTRSAGRSCERSVWRSPVACAFLSVPKL